MSEHQYLGLPAVGAPFQGRVRCCEEDTGGSHNHCARCGRVGSYQGCYGNHDSFTKGEKKGWGFYCPEPFGFATMDQFKAEREAK